MGWNTSDDVGRAGLVLYVATWGDDHSDGSKHTPLASLAAARDATREHRKTEGLDEGSTVVIEEGTYVLSETLELDAQDSGTAANPIVYRAAAEATVRISGGQLLKTSDFAVVADPAILDRLMDSSVGRGEDGSSKTPDQPNALGMPDDAALLLPTSLVSADARGGEVGCDPQNPFCIPKWELWIGDLQAMESTWRATPVPSSAPEGAGQ